MPMPSIINCFLSISADLLYLYNGDPYCGSPTNDIREILNFTRCIQIQRNSTRVISAVKPLDVATPLMRYSVRGIGIDCSPINGLMVRAGSVNGSLHKCTTLTGVVENDLVTCRYRCSCPDGCSFVMIKTVNIEPQSLCASSIDLNL